MSLRVVVFDATDSPRRVRLDHDGSNGTSQVRLGLSPAWWVGARLHALARALSRVPYRARGVRSWDEAVEFTVSCAREAPITELQVWGHGGWGFMDLGDTRLDRQRLATVDPLADVLADDAQVWLRCCSAFGGRAGRAFAPALAERLRRRVVGHTYVIGALQSGTHSLAPFARPDWPLEEGVVMVDGEPRSAKDSSFGEPRTLGCLRLDLPAGF